MSRTRNYTFTLFEPAHITKFDEDKMRYLVYQQEICPTTDRKHYQGYVVFNNAVALKGAKKLMKSTSIHMEAAYGTLEENQRYCQKSETSIPDTFNEYGIAPKEQGTRTDVHNFIKDAGNLTDLELLQKHPEATLKFHNRLTFVRNAQLEHASRGIRLLDVWYIWGPPGTGKSRFVFDTIHDLPYYKPATVVQSRPTWFDGYRGEDILWLDDLCPTAISYGDIINWLDVYPLRVQVKGAFTHVMWKTVYITSNTPPTVYNAAIQRRFHHIIHMDSPSSVDKTPEEVYNNSLESTPKERFEQFELNIDV